MLFKECAKAWSFSIIVIMLATILAPDLYAESPRSLAQTYQNPLAVDIADPHVLFHNGTYYLYGTTGPEEGFIVRTSDDLVNWTERGFAYRRTPTSWGQAHYWAPSVIEYRGAFYLFYNAVGPVAPHRHSHRICVARSESPLGPFIDIKTPIVDVGQAMIDAHVFVDDDGKAYLYYSLDVSENEVSEVCVLPLSADLQSAIGLPTRCLRPSQAWEGHRWNEAPFVFKHGDTYIMTYSAQGFFDPRYAVGYATAPSPMGPWTKSASNPFLHRTDDVSGPGHNCIVPSPDGTELFILYHAHKNLTGGIPRHLAMDRLEVNAVNGRITLSTNGPTTTPQPMPSRDGMLVGADAEPLAVP